MITGPPPKFHGTRDILRAVWDAHYEGDDNVVEVYIGYLRRKIDQPFDRNSIDTLRGVGYRMRMTGSLPNGTPLQG